MHKFMGLIAAIFGILAFIATLLLWYGYHTADNMAFKHWAMISGAAAVILGVIAHFLPRDKGELAPESARFGIGFGLGAILAILIAKYFLMS